MEAGATAADIAAEIAHRNGLSEQESQGFGLLLKVYSREERGGAITKALREDKIVREELARQSARWYYGRRFVPPGPYAGTPRGLELTYLEASAAVILQGYPLPVPSGAYRPDGCCPRGSKSLFII